MRNRRAFVLAAVLGAAVAAAPRAADGPYKFIKDIQIGGEGGWDYLTRRPAPPTASTSATPPKSWSST